MRGYYMGLVMPSIVVVAALTVYFNVICSNLYPVLFLIIEKAGGIDEQDYMSSDDTPYKSFGKFSIAWVALGVYVMLVTINIKKDLSIFMKMSFMGAMCASMLILFVIYQGISSIADQESNLKITVSGTTPEENRPDTIEIFMFSGGVANLAGVLCAGYFLH